MLVSPSEYARHRGCTPAAVTAAMKQRIAEAIVMRGSKRLIDKEKADHLWNSRGARPPKAIPRSKREEVEPRQLLTAEQLRSVVESLPEDAIPDLEVSRERKEHYQAELARVNAMKEREKLVVADDVKQEASRLARQVRDLLLIIPGRNAAKLATIQDSEVIRELLEGEITSALRGLANA